MSKLTHFDDSGQAHMVNVGDKTATKRAAIARGTIFMSEPAFLQVKAGDNKKGDVLGIARIAAIQATKATANLIPLCHPLALTHVHVDIVLSRANYSIILEVTTETFGTTGVEMEALTGVSIGLLTIYDMVKAVDKSMRISDIQLLEKSGGKSGHYLAENKHALKD